jgi:hypothetical protein
MGILAGQAQANARNRSPPRLRNFASTFRAMGKTRALRQLALRTADCIFHGRVYLILYRALGCPTRRHASLLPVMSSLQSQHVPLWLPQGHLQATRATDA